MAGERILIVDDNQVNLKLMRVLLAGEGYEVRTATDAEEALQVLEKFSPRLILMDIQLPGLDGYEVTRRIKSKFDLGHIPIIAVTSYALSGDDQKAYAAGCDGYVTKPFSPRQLLAKIREFLP